ncbi:3-deoxy-D-arabino-heptulosonate 7-phosphate synthase [Roseateles amylovorans]|uniref:3-deoxy-D-arabino-heptulosonate 7-phosphate synthase n=1 Tax=Roseateles amylovorans TaxID=2978473 RepID=A0ABY6B1V4_9BURK|nr:3-deoxy-D-arabino-heptulosonate 7-phosphate synthase [Roseateles amylovorans]UXH79149.1 3-deoxy-D-arabino-heptulosonate 7-phosphate synthase [Roseateles amylovorans]
MSPIPLPAPLARMLLACVRRYRAPALPASLDEASLAGPATALAFAIDQARVATVQGVTPEPAVRALFIHALARLIAGALRPQGGDPAFQAMVLQHQWPVVREFASLNAHAAADRRTVQSTIRAFAHPEKTRRRPDAALRAALTELHRAGEAADWPRLVPMALALLDQPDVRADPALRRLLERLRDETAVDRLQRLAVLAHDERIQRYLRLWQQQGPRSGTAEAHARGSRAQARGAAVEAQASHALEAVARRLNEEDAAAPYRVVTGLLVPGAIPGDPQGAKSEWDVALLRRAEGHADASAWDLCLLVEAKASADAATTDVYKLQRGLQRLQQASDGEVHAFACDQGEVGLTGASLRALTLGAGEGEGEGAAQGPVPPCSAPAQDDRLDASRSVLGSVLYCSNATADRTPPLLNPASRMQLMSAPAAVAFASQWAEATKGTDVATDGETADPQPLHAVWLQLLNDPVFDAVRQQYPTLRQVRDLMVHPDDLLAAAGAAARDCAHGTTESISTSCTAGTSRSS